jgi:hypothetical protein
MEPFPHIYSIVLGVLGGRSYQILKDKVLSKSHLHFVFSEVFRLHILNDGF